MQRALFIILRSVQMIAQLQVGSIFFLSIIVPTRCLSTNTHLMEQRKWGEKNMACAIDCVYKNYFLNNQSWTLFDLQRLLVNTIYGTSHVLLSPLPMFQKMGVSGEPSHRNNNRKKKYGSNSQLCNHLKNFLV